MAPRKTPASTRKPTAGSELSATKRKRSSQKTPTTKTRPQNDSDSESEELELDSDDLDESDDDRQRRKKPKRAAPSPSKSKRTLKRKSKKKEFDDSNEERLELQDGQEIVGEVIKAPTTGLVPAGQISQNTLNFLNKLKDPECNDRQWFKLHEPVYRVAEKEWKDFIESFTDVLIEVDDEIPILPPKDVIHRIYRDIRFSNDKTPYKTGLSASFSRSGRKGIFAGFKPGNESLIAAGTWCPAKNELDTIRSNIKRDSGRLREIISFAEFEQFFGVAKPHPNGERQNIFGREDELKTAPKGVPKDHQDIDLLKCRSFAVAHCFTDDEVLDVNFKQELGYVAQVMRPFVRCLNDLMTITPDDDNSDDGAEQDSGQEDDD
ncbi:hypothetical protein AGABI2DRAFT_209325 [Agaricus bisporus var. bisporus H97]|uniref:hypothetical protein n=1 Tax=Agaricus bisporus var. bisporus (strain H97 / ATCC MYA-4626 / FGSC 10389) TaxID=936046 RepID=UPI00029F73D9|nr:hypothetical protein AGABI2DRAFT_209325 [Agaricus bisporus var. bisporus H97]EKV43790.1 hypothetical protein AGABI2DRAFT_209325 [Agaricus bisporus var. bisporus H97]